MQRFLIPTAVLVVLGSMGVTRVVHMQSGLEDLQASRAQVPARLLEMRDEMLQAESRWSERIAKLQGELNLLQDAKTEQSGSLTKQLQEATATLDDQRTRILELQRALETQDVDQKLREVSERFSGLSESVNSTLDLVASTREDLGRIQNSISPAEAEVTRRWQRIVGPTVQMAGASTVGSGVVLQSTPLADGSGHETLVLTAWHVVRDILADKLDPLDMTVPVTIYLENGNTEGRTALLLGKNAKIDAALLVLQDKRKVPTGATLASRSYLESRRIFHSIYAVGCPLGNDPIPTPGEIADLEHAIDGSTYWMISAPTYIGNSGGGIYDEQTNHLMGLFSKIYTHGNVRPTIVPHMGLVSPLALVYDWLEEEGIAEVIDHDDQAIIVVR